MNIFRYFKYKRLKKDHELKVELRMKLKRRVEDEEKRELNRKKNEELHAIRVHKKALRHKKNRIYLRQAIQYSNWRY